MNSLGESLDYNNMAQAKNPFRSPKAPREPPAEPQVCDLAGHQMAWLRTSSHLCPSEDIAIRNL